MVGVAPAEVNSSGMRQIPARDANRTLSLLLLLTLHSAGQTWNLEPESPAQGDVIHVSTTSDATHARLGNRTVRLFRQLEGRRLGLMPIPAVQKPGRYRVDFLDSGGRPLHQTPITVRDAQFPEQNVELSSAVEALKPRPGETETLNSFRNLVSENRLWSEPFEKPVAGCMVSPFGVQRLHNGRRTGNYHGGIDQRGAAGTPVHAVADGFVRIVQSFTVPGNTVGIDHGQGLTSMYLHLSQFATSEGTRISKGDLIGYVGTTGRSTAPHLHWGLAAQGVSVNPAQFVNLTPCAKTTPTKTRTRRRRAR